MGEVIEFPKIVRCKSPEETLEHAKGWNFESVIIAGRQPDDVSGVTLFISETTDPRTYLEIAEAARAAYHHLKGTFK